MKKTKKIMKFRVFSLIAMLIFLTTLFLNNILPFRIEIVIAIVTLLVFFFVLYKRSKVLNIVFVVMMLVPTMGLFYSQSIFNRIFNNDQFETKKISFVKRTTNNLTIGNITAETIFGLSSNFDEDNQLHINNDLKERFDFESKIVQSESDLDTIQGLYDGLYEIGIIDNAVIDTISETYPSFQLDFDVLWSVERIIVRDDIVKPVEVNKNSFIVLISGIDINGSLKLRSRSDVNILAAVNPDSGTITLVSIPRDMFVPFSCQNNALDKLTHSGIYGVNCTVQTIENFLDIDINYYVRLNFTSFIKIIDVIGNIEVYSKYAFSTVDGYSYKSGMNILNSQKALSFARERHAFEEGDVQRGLNQQEVIKAVIRKLISPNTITKIDKIVSSVAKSIDTNMDSESVQKLVALQIDKGVDWQFNSYFVSGTEAMRETFSVPGRDLFVVLPSQDSVNEISETIKTALR